MMSDDQDIFDNVMKQTSRTMKWSVYNKNLNYYDMIKQ
jgi:hypothetical protein